MSEGASAFNEPGSVEVVAAAIVRDGRVLAARRSGPPIGWEFPGGKLEPGETPAAALARECREELGVAVVVGPELGRAAEVDGDRSLTLTLFACTTEEGEPAAGFDHDELRWLGADELDAVEWLPLDVALLTDVRDWLTRPAHPTR